MRIGFWLAILLHSFTGIGSAADSWELGSSTQLRPAPLEEARKILATEDEFLRQLSPFDRSARLRTNGPVTSAQFMAFVTNQVRPWNEEELRRLESVCQSISNRLAGWKLPFPETIQLVKTSGDEEGQAAYTRGAAIVLPEADLMKSPAQLERILLHELFHILSRHQPKLREALYALVGFLPCGPVSLPGEYAARKLTNPDAPLIEHQIKGRVGDREVQVMPVLFSREAVYRAGDRRPFFVYLEFRLMEIAPAADGWLPVIRDGRPIFHQPSDVGNFFEQIGGNTQYIIHPEEVLADNFVLLLMGQSEVANPEIPNRMAELLRRSAPGGPDR